MNEPMGYRGLYIDVAADVMWEINQSVLDNFTHT
jgi:hypothetical protein